MKNKKLLVLALALVFVFAMSAVAFAADTGTITITAPTSQQAPTVDSTYEVYKVFDATVNADDNTKVNYTLCSGDTLSQAMKDAGFSVDAAGNVTGPDSLDEDAIAAIAAYVTDDDLVDTVTVAVGETSGTTKELPYGYYYITTSTGTAVTIDSNNDNPTVNDKNVIPKVEKSAGTAYDANSLQAIAAVGTSQDFTAVITTGNGAKNVVFKDTMTNLTYNGDAKVYVGGTEVAAGDDTFSISGAEGDSSFTITFVDSYIAGLDKNTEITIKYSGTVTSDALSSDPATNKAELTSGDGNKSESEEVEVYNAKISVLKQDGDNEPLEGAGFVLKNSDGKYYTLANGEITWVDSIDDADEHFSDADGNVAPFTGLADGTYTLEEKTVPAGYNKADDEEVTIKGDDYTTDNLEQEATVTNNAGAELPSTGGIGTTIFMVLGGILMAAAVVLFITKKRVGAEK